MVKKAPERKVLHQQEDIFYVYDKRINKCIRPDCDGIVKYGLVLKVTMANGQTLNSFACNNCRMKYTPYANYVRLDTPAEIEIYNKEEIMLRDKKRADDAKKQREHRKGSGFKGNNAGKKVYGKRDSDRKTYDRKSDGRNSYWKKSDDNKSKKNRYSSDHKRKEFYSSRSYTNSYGKNKD